MQVECTFDMYISCPEYASRRLHCFICFDTLPGTLPARRTNEAILQYTFSRLKKYDCLQSSKSTLIVVTAIAARISQIYIYLFFIEVVVPLMLLPPRPFRRCWIDVISLTVYVISSDSVFVLLHH
jgi:hypothetical protein